MMGYSFVPPLGGGVLAGLDLALDLFRDGVLGVLDVVAGLQVHPELWAGAEVAAEPEGGVDAYAAFAVNNLVDAVRWHAQRHRKLIHRDVGWLEKLLEQNLAGVDGGNFALVSLHGHGLLHS